MISTTCPTEADFVARLRTGDEAAYETLFRTHAGAMLAVARRHLGCTDDAADAVQEAFISAFRAMPKFQGTARLGTWLHRITVNACRMKMRSRRRNRQVPLVGDHPAAPAAASPDCGVEAAARVRAGIERLPARYQVVIRLRDLEGLDTDATAARLNTNRAVVKTRLHRARHALKLLLNANRDL